MREKDYASRFEGMPTPSRRATRSQRRRTRLAVGMILVAVLYSMCRIPEWSGSDPRELDAHAQRNAARSLLTDEEHRRALVVVIKRRATEDARLLLEMAAEDGPASIDAAKALEHLRKELRD